ncbi:DNA-binding MarR family transcriptional regulator [Rhodopseudomonas julia]|uniref:DNA-binding MarR family transcriptional regulator n=1 Tax=Rhodopseudomonas julia TaxID=200617 RepID=A0ABU0C4Q1_9BRAD|nr:MarR family transcriptional regulator [Rhodopseudomonas julia]MDQ0325148.1 DNA-binding MarR family transcriptional regulator [Rhodopseudomonas julia]
MPEDVVRALGFLCLGTRLRRIGERLQADTDAILATKELAINASHYPYLASLDRLGSMTLGDLAEAVGVSQPGATRAVNQLIGQGLLKAEASLQDRRCKIVDLTDEGRQLVEAGKSEVWPRIEAAVADLCRDLRGPLLQQLAELEDGLAEASLARRTEGRSER